MSKACSEKPEAIRADNHATPGIMKLFASRRDALESVALPVLAMAGALRRYRGVNETISSLLLAYTAIALFKHFVEGPMRDPARLNKPSTRPLDEAVRIGGLWVTDIHWGLMLGIAACVLLGLWLFFTTSGFATPVVGGNARAARLVGLQSGRIVVVACAIGGACADLVGGIEVAAVHTSANAALIAGLGYAGILVAVVARKNPWVIMPVAVLFGASVRPAACCSAGLACPTPRCWCCRASPSC